MLHTTCTQYNTTCIIQYTMLYTLVAELEVMLGVVNYFCSETKWKGYDNHTTQKNIS